MDIAGRLKGALATLFSISICIYPNISQAQDAKSLAIELNATQQVDQNCRLMFVAKNELDHEIENLTLEAVLFDKSGTVNRFTLLDFQELPKSKMRVRQFDLSGAQCNQVGQLLLNGVSSCASPTLGEDDCSDTLKTTSRTSVDFSG